MADAPWSASIRAARLSEEAAMASFQRTVNDVVFDVRRLYYLALLSQALIGASIPATEGVVGERGGIRLDQ